MPDSDIRESEPFVCPVTGVQHMIGKEYDERRGVGNGPQICLNCRKTLMSLFTEEMVKFGEFVIGENDELPRKPEYPNIDRDLEYIDREFYVKYCNILRAEQRQRLASLEEQKSMLRKNTEHEPKEKK